MEDTFFTFFTPIYNRKHTIHRVWESLINQTNKNFEWLVVDDGSEDGVEELLMKYKEEADFTVRLFHQKNSGKHIAFNKAIDEARGELLIPADSDDSFIASTIEVFNENWKKYKRDAVAGITVLCVDEENNIVGDKFPTEGVLNYKDLAFKHEITGEKWGCIRVDILKKYKFPEIIGAHFFPESYIWLQIDLNYDSVYLNIPLRTYFQDSGNQVTKDYFQSMGAIKVKNHYTIWWLNTIYPTTSRYSNYKIIIFRKFISVWKTSFLLERSYLSVLREMNSTKNKLFVFLSFFPSFILFKIFRYKFKD